MKFYSAVWLFAAVINLSLCSQAKAVAQFPDVRADESKDAAAFLRMEQAIEDAVVRADLEYLKNIYAEDFRFAHGSGSVQNKSEWLKSVAKRQFISRQVSANEVEIHGDIAITSARLDVTRRGKNGEEKYWIKYIRVYRRGGDHWKMISHRTIQETHL